MMQSKLSIFFRCSAVRFFTLLDFQPFLPEFSRGPDFFIGKNMGMPADHLGAYRINYITYGKQALFIMDPGQQNNQIQEVS